LGNRVVCFDTDSEKIALLQRGEVPIFEPGLAEMVARNVKNGRLFFSRDPREVVTQSDIIFIAVGTPMADSGHADLTDVREAAMTIAKHLNGKKIIVNKSTVPVHTGDLVTTLIDEYRSGGHRVAVVSNPEFVRQGSAISDFMNPDRIVLGVPDEETGETMRGLYAPLGVPIVLVSVRTAEMIKYTANAFLATKISFINEIANLCEAVGADVKDVVAGAGSDQRIGTAFMQPGLGFGGSCFPKDIMALSKLAESKGVQSRLLRAVLETNAAQIEIYRNAIVSKLGDLKGVTLALLGLAFKPNTDDVRESPALALAEQLLAKGARLAVHDPAAVSNARRELKGAVRWCSDIYEAAKDARALIVATDWSEYKELDFGALASAMSDRTVFDCRNIYEPAELAKHGFEVVAIGRAHVQQDRRVPQHPVEKV
ncbi:MAG: UDP-glucose/GDP-mannose dehydrogenase family protein, partial [Candidatus Eremiobacteraeota bacterium]|nr:UDP-glucose/GDP-mannose dehydrogenase family protein [Candidatus Eremiobacteraeota bacterium]